MKKISLVLTLLTLGFSLNLIAQEAVFPKGNKGSNDFFTGTVWVNVLSPTDDTFNTQIGNVTFEAGARTNWHTHGGGQILLVSEGFGYYQEKGKAIQTIKKGDVVKCLPDVEHWHGASLANAMTHIAVNTNTQKPVVTWGKPVTDVEYREYQAKAGKVQPFGKEAFGKSNQTTIRWTGNAGFLINSRGTTAMVDPLMKDFDMPTLFHAPILPKDVPQLDVVLVSHSDNDHFSIPTCMDLAPVTRQFHSTHYVDSLMKNLKFPSTGHNIGDVFKVGSMNIKLTPADHDWQNSFPGAATRFFKKEDCTGFMIETPDGSIWAQGDSRLMPEHLTMKEPDAILFDFSDSEFHFTFEGALKIAEAYPNAKLILSHWGTIDSPNFNPFNADPEKLRKQVKNPNRIVVLALGQPYILNRLNKK